MFVFSESLPRERFI